MVRNQVETIQMRYETLRLRPHPGCSRVVSLSCLLQVSLRHRAFESPPSGSLALDAADAQSTCCTLHDALLPLTLPRNTCQSEHKKSPTHQIFDTIPRLCFSAINGLFNFIAAVSMSFSGVHRSEMRAILRKGLQSEMSMAGKLPGTGGK